MIFENVIGDIFTGVIVASLLFVFLHWILELWVKRQALMSELWPFRQVLGLRVWLWAAVIMLIVGVLTSLYANLLTDKFNTQTSPVEQGREEGREK